jgi:hypothetical protein
MKNTLLLSALFLSSSLSAQIFITSAHFIDASDVVQIGIDNNPSISHTQAGPNQTWNYGELNINETNVIAMGMADWYSGASNFPQATLGTEDEDGIQVFFRKTTEAFDLMGVYGDFFGEGTNMAFAYTPYQRQLTFPSTYGTAFTNVSTLKVKLDDIEDFDSIVVTITTHRVSEMDAWGNLTTPYGTFPSIRQHIKDSTITDIKGYLFGFPIFTQTETEITHNYSFYSDAQNARYVLLQYNFDPETELLSGVQWQTSAPVLNTPNVAVNEYTVYPNPAHNEVNIKFPTATSGDLVVVDVLGKVVHQKTIQNSDFSQVDVSKWNPGVYFFQFTTENNRITKKITVK